MVVAPPGVEVLVDMRVELDVAVEEPSVVDRVVDGWAVAEQWHSLRKSLNKRFYLILSRDNKNVIH